MGLRLLHLNLHGLIRSHDLELGRDSDTGGQTLYVLELVKGLAARPEVEKVQLFLLLVLQQVLLLVLKHIAFALQYLNPSQAQDHETGLIHANLNVIVLIPSKNLIKDCGLITDF